MSAQNQKNQLLVINPRHLGRYGITFILLIYTAVASFPFFWTVANSFRPGPISGQTIMAVSLKTG